MKKYIKLISVMLLATLMCLMFCSCKELDKMREDHAVWGNDARTVIVFQNAEYKLLPACNDLSLMPDVKNSRGVVTEPDVPVLLSSTYGQSMSISKNKEMLVSGHWENDYKCNKVYCRTDLYDKMVSAIESYEMNRYCVSESIYWYDEVSGIGRGMSVYRLLSEESIQIIKDALASDGRAMNNYAYNGYELYFCDETLQFVAEDDGFWIVSEPDGCSLVTHKTSDGILYEEYMYYDIPQESAQKLMNDIMNNTNEN